MHNPHKCNPALGLEIEAMLKAKGIQTPTTGLLSAIPEQDKISVIADHLQQALSTLGLNLLDDSLAETPKRIAKMWVRELMWGLHPENFPKVTTIENKMRYNEMLIERGITVMSLCEHHAVTIQGVAHVAYIPKDKVAGLSKFNRVVEYFARRPQVQERLTAQIFHALQYILGTEDVAVVVDARHYCVISRGVEDESSETLTSMLGGKFLEPAVRAEFMALINAPSGLAR